MNLSKRALSQSHAMRHMLHAVAARSRGPAVFKSRAHGAVVARAATARRLQTAGTVEASLQTQKIRAHFMSLSASLIIPCYAIPPRISMCSSRLEDTSEPSARWRKYRMLPRTARLRPQRPPASVRRGQGSFS